MASRVDESLFERMVSLRRDLHQHPELSWEEERTCSRVEEALTRLGIPHRRMAGTGIVGELPGPEGVAHVALRADLDALPILEETGLPFASSRPGVMHACGHDGHTSMLLGAAEVLLRATARPAPIRLIFQPAEETGEGAKAMIDEGVLEGVGLIFGGHLDRRFAPGSLIVTEGAVNASTDTFRIEIGGQGGHAARPHETVDAVVVGSLMVMAIQTIVSREVDPADPAVVSVGRFDAGTVANAIAGQAYLEGTIRTLRPVVRDHFRAAIRRIAESVASTHAAEATVTFTAGTPALHNAPNATAVAREAAVRVVGEGAVDELRQANMGGEDFAYYLREVPGCYVRFGSQIAGQRNFPAHSTKFAFDESALAWGASWLAEVAEVGGAALASGQTFALPAL